VETLVLAMGQDHGFLPAHGVRVEVMDHALVVLLETVRLPVPVPRGPVLDFIRTTVEQHVLVLVPLHTHRSLVTLQSTVPFLVFVSERVRVELAPPFLVFRARVPSRIDVRELTAVHVFQLVQIAPVLTDDHALRIPSHLLPGSRWFSPSRSSGLLLFTLGHFYFLYRQENKIMSELILSRDGVLTLSFFFGFTGLDRLYAGCYISGILKFVLFLTYLLVGNNPALVISENTIELKMLLGLLVFLWYIIDLFRLLWNAGIQSSTRVLCGGYVWEDTIYTQKYAAFLTLIFFVVAYYFLNNEYF